MWLIGFEAGFLPLYTKARALVPETVWATYSETGFTGTFEQKELALAIKIIKKEWSQRPSILRKDDANRKKRL